MSQEKYVNLADLAEEIVNDESNIFYCDREEIIQRENLSRDELSKLSPKSSKEVKSKLKSVHSKNGIVYALKNAEIQVPSSYQNRHAASQGEYKFDDAKIASIEISHDNKLDGYIIGVFLKNNAITDIRINSNSSIHFPHLEMVPGNNIWHRSGKIITKLDKQDSMLEGIVGVEVYLSHETRYFNITDKRYF